jgi:hypothetical protein
MSIKNILKKKQVTSKDLYDCCLLLFKDYLTDDNQILFNSIKYIKYDKHFCNKINIVLKNKKLDDKKLFKTVKYHIYLYIYKRLHNYLNEQDNYEQNIYKQYNYEQDINKQDNYVQGIYEKDIYEQDIYEHWDIDDIESDIEKDIGTDIERERKRERERERERDRERDIKKMERKDELVRMLLTVKTMKQKDFDQKILKEREKIENDIANKDRQRESLRDIEELKRIHKKMRERNIKPEEKGRIHDLYLKDVNKIKEERDLYRNKDINDIIKIEKDMINKNTNFKDRVIALYKEKEKRDKDKEEREKLNRDKLVRELEERIYK